MQRLEAENPELAENTEFGDDISSGFAPSIPSLDAQMDEIFAYSRARQEFEEGRNEIMEQMASLNESLDAYGREHPSIEKYSDILVNSIGVVAMAGIVLTAPEVGLVTTMGTAATTVAYDELFNCLLENGSDKFVEYCALQGRTEAESVRYGTAAAGIVGKLLKIAVIRGGLKSIGGKTSSKAKVLSKTEAEAVSKHVFQEKTANENAVMAKVNQGIFDAVNKAPYNPRAMETMLKARYPEAEIVSSTMPIANAKNVKLAGFSKEFVIGADEVTGQPIVKHIPFNERGLPIFDDVSVCDLKLPKNISDIKNRDLHFKSATTELKKLIELGKIDKSIFSEEQIKSIFSESIRIPGFTWHHHEDTGRMQLIPRRIHKTIGHFGGFDLWYK